MAIFVYTNTIIKCYKITLGDDSEQQLRHNLQGIRCNLWQPKVFALQLDVTWIVRDANSGLNFEWGNCQFFYQLRYCGRMSYRSVTTFKTASAGCRQIRCGRAFYPTSILNLASSKLESLTERWLQFIVMWWRNREHKGMRLQLGKLYMFRSSFLGTESYKRGQRLWIQHQCCANWPLTLFSTQKNIVSWSNFMSSSL
jgi:hypothetical protein